MTAPMITFLFMVFLRFPLLEILYNDGYRKAMPQSLRIM
jgi:hypothetical protein